MPADFGKPEIVVYTLPLCAGCEQVKSYLNAKQLEFSVRNLETDPEAQAELQALGARSAPTVKIGDTVIVGFNPRKLDKALAARTPA